MFLSVGARSTIQTTVTLRLTVGRYHVVGAAGCSAICCLASRHPSFAADAVLNRHHWAIQIRQIDGDPLAQRQSAAVARHRDRLSPPLAPCRARLPAASTSRCSVPLPHARVGNQPPVEEVGKKIDWRPTPRLGTAPWRDRAGEREPHRTEAHAIHIRKLAQGHPRDPPSSLILPTSSS
jgi:hypothetical protein